MGFSKFNNISIDAVASCVPKEKISNLEYPFLFTIAEKETIVKNTGIEERRIADPNTFVSDLGFEAAKTLFENENINPDEISSIVFLSQTHDYKLPFVSNILQDRLGLSNNCLCVDINAACSGFITGLQTSFSILSGLDQGKVLFIVAETMSKIVSKEDRSTSLLFGDAASALLISKKQGSKESYFSAHSDGEYHDVIAIPHGGTKYKFSEESLKYNEYEDGSKRNALELYMDAFGVYNFTMKRIPPSVETFNSKVGIETNDLDYYIFHQANRFILKRFAKKLKLEPGKLVVNIDRFGNTSGVSIPLAITTELINTTGRRLVHCSGFGAGLSWGNAILDLTETKIIELKEV